MTLELDDLDLFSEPDDSAEQRVVVVEREPRKCKRHQWSVVPIGWATEMQAELRCRRCGKVRDEARVRRGKTSRNRGNAFEREVAAKLGGRRVGQYGDQVDVDVPGYMRIQTKNGGTYPRLIDRWLRAIPVEAGLLRAVVLGDAPGPGTRRRSLIVMDLDEFAAWHGGTR